MYVILSRMCACAFTYPRSMVVGDPYASFGCSQWCAVGEEPCRRVGVDGNPDRLRCVDSSDDFDENSPHDRNSSSRMTWTAAPVFTNHYSINPSPSDAYAPGDYITVILRVHRSGIVRIAIVG